ncbi:MAG: xanthine dehydrogenase family protein subunit M [Alphaproteobacteria bacterium]|nr:xanthine dehydrogenase family protein subunit M [Alphaproteobacteria bacterium]
MYAFQYQKPDTAAQALQVVREQGSQYLAGGQSLVQAMKLRMSSPAALVDLSGLLELQGIEVGAQSVRIGAMTRHARVADDAPLGSAIPALAALAGGIGDPMVRNQGTLGGSLAYNDPAACYPSATLALRATIHTDARDIAAEDFFLGLYQTALNEGELIRAVTFQQPQAAAYIKFKHPASKLALVGVFVARFADGVRVGVTGAQACAFRATAIEAALTKDFSPQAAQDVRLSAVDMLSDMHAGAAYRAALVSTLAARAVSRIQGA